MARRGPGREDEPDVDVVVIGAGLSGIDAACRLHQECPDRSYQVLEMRDAMGGTWDLFRYPGIRSDSDIFTFSYPFRPWQDPKAIADGPTILNYIQETAAEYGVDRHIRYRTRVVGADWSSEDALWTLTLVETDTEGRTTESVTTCRFVYACTGYYDYEHPYEPELPGLADFAGEVVRPQFWPEDLDYADRRVLIVGSGATAVTLAPAMSVDAAQVTMLQRSPTWIGVVPAQDRFADRVRAVLPAGVAHRVVRARQIVRLQAVYEFCRRWPRAARRLLLGLTTRALRSEELVREHFTPRYDPWEQRFCVARDGDFFRAVRRGRVEVVTDHVDRFVPDGVLLRSGRLVDADIVVLATGLKVLVGGGIRPTVDGVEVDLRRQFLWQGALLTGLPNFAIAIGYVNASWTLRADLSARLVCKVLAEMTRRDAVSVVPVLDRDVEPRPLLPLSSGYIQRALDDLPSQGDSGPWRVRQNYLLDAVTTMHADLDRGLRFEPAFDPLRHDAHELRARLAVRP